MAQVNFPYCPGHQNTDYFKKVYHFTNGYLNHSVEFVDFAFQIFPKIDEKPIESSLVRGHSINTWNFRGGVRGGSQRCVTHFFFAFRSTDIKLFEVKSFVSLQDKASQDTLFIILFAVQSKLGSKISDQKQQKCHRICQKKVTYYLNGPLAKYPQSKL